jgi:hypothetical protein
MTKPVGRSELRRLGKLGSYRLGTLAPQGIGRPAPPKQFRPTFGRTRRDGSAAGRVLSALAGAALIGGGAMIGLWFLPLAAGVLTGIAARFLEFRLRSAVLVVLFMCGAGWGGALIAFSARGQPVGATARAIAAIAGLPAYAAVAIACTLAVSMLLGLAGLWLGRALTPRSAR